MPAARANGVAFPRPLCSHPRPPRGPTPQPGQDDASTPSNGQPRRRGSVTGRSGSSASRQGQRRNTSPAPPNQGSVPRSMKAAHSTPDVMGSPERRVAKAVSTAQKRVRQRSVQFHGRRMGLEIGCRVDILNKSRRPIPNLVSDTSYMATATRASSRQGLGKMKRPAAGTTVTLHHQSTSEEWIPPPPLIHNRRHHPPRSIAACFDLWACSTSHVAGGLA